MLLRRARVHTCQCICILRAGVLSSSELSRVLEERQILSIVSHPFIVALAGSFQTPNSFYFIMTYAGGGDLTRWMQRQIGEPTARYVSAEVRRR